MGEYHQITLSEWLEQKEQLRKELNNIREGFVRVGYVLRRMEDSRAYEAEGYKSVAEFAEKEHGLKPSTTSRWMAINREFSLDGYSMQLDPRYIDMNASQLAEMLVIAVEDREMIRPETKREDIRELKRLEKEEPPKESGLEQIIRLFLEENEDIHTDIISWMTFRPADQAGLIERVNPSGNRSFRKNGMMLMMYEDYIKFKAAGKKPETAEWSEFFGIAGKIELPKDEEEGIDGPAAVEEPAQEAGTESPEGSICEMGESRGVDDEGREEVSEREGNDAYGTRGILQEDISRIGNARGGDRAGREEDYGAGSRGESHEGSGDVGAGNHPGKEDDETDRCGEGCGQETERLEGAGSGGEKTAAAGGIEGGQAETAAMPQLAEDPADPAEEEKPAGSLTDDFPAPEGVENAERTATVEIAPAQFDDDNDDGDGDAAEEEMTLPGKISQARREVRLCLRDISGKIDFRAWDKAYEAAVKLLGYLDFLREHDAPS